ncbi:MAG TPA: radical SAM protein [Candidatus Acidoferrales bacterium]|nr:radical SAM protein [Candidatus Acidoferrales bacterium]
MSALLAEMAAKSFQLGVPFSVHLDLTYRCNERCVHCYLDHDDHGEMTTAEIKDVLKQLADAGVFVLVLSGGEIMLRKDIFEIVEYARELTFCVKLKTNAILIGDREAERLRDLDIDSIQVSIYSHRPEVHDAITKVPGSLKRSLKAIRFLKSKGLKVTIANVLMNDNAADYAGVQQLAAQLGIESSLDPTVTPMMNGDRSVLALNVNANELKQVFRDPTLVENVDEFCAMPAKADEDLLESHPCSAGHSACYVSPYGDVYPCVQFPLPSGNVRKQKFIDIWNYSEQLNEVRSIKIRDLPNCSACGNISSCSRCPGLAYMEGNMRGPSTQDCEKSYARTGILSVNLQNRKARGPGLVHIQGLDGRPALLQIQSPEPVAEALSA